MVKSDSNHAIMNEDDRFFLPWSNLTMGKIIVIVCGIRGDDSSLPLCYVSYTYTNNSLLILIYYRLGQNLLIIIKYAVRSRYSSWPIQLVKD